MNESGCIVCGRGFHDECKRQPCCCGESDNNISDTHQTSEYKYKVSSRENEVPNGENRRGSEQIRDNVTISAGRKRAAKQYELDVTTPCEWRGKANCGGGFIPVVGCLIGFQEARHHGPDKSTTNNSEDNVHLICASCHGAWHRANDPKYGPEDKSPEGVQKHSPKWATVEELVSTGRRIIVK